MRRWVRCSALPSGTSALPHAYRCGRRQVRFVPKLHLDGDASDASTRTIKRQLEQSFDHYQCLSQSILARSKPATASFDPLPYLYSDKHPDASNMLVAAKDSSELTPNATSLRLPERSVILPDSPTQCSDSAIFEKYDPITGTEWDIGSDLPYIFLSQLFLDVQFEARRNTNVKKITNFFRSVIAKSPEALLPAAYLTVNKIGPDYESQEYGVGDVLILKTLSQKTGKTLEEISDEYRRIGDLGECAVKLLSHHSSSTDRFLTVSFVFDQLRRVSQENTVDGKIRLIDDLLSCCREVESRYLIRTFQRTLRIGCSIRTVLVGLASAFVLTPPLSSEERANISRLPAERLDRSLCIDHSLLQKEVFEAIATVRRAWVEYPNLSRIISILLDYRINELPNHCRLTPGVPIKSMQASPAKSISQVLEAFANQNLVLEYKYDGERVQIHLLEDGTVQVFSRSAESTTSKFPDIVALLPKIVKDNSITSCIIDAEAVAFDHGKGAPLPFQVLSTRKRKDVNIEDVSVNICVFAFDLIYVNGKSLLTFPLRERRRLLHSNFQQISGKFQFSVSKETNNVSEISSFLQKSVSDHCEGLMIKCLDEGSQFASYEPDKRSHAWRKLKQDYMHGLTDSFDLVPIGAYFGKGKRFGTFGGYLLAVYDPANLSYQAICKIGSGFKDEDLSSLTAWANNHLIEAPRNYYEFGEEHLPDVWLDASQVWEIKAASFTISPVYKAAIGLIHPCKGIGLRFPRFIQVRTDKKPEDSCTTSTQIAELYHIQEPPTR